MCHGGRLLADFVAGSREQPNVPELAGSLTHTAEGEWVVWAYKLARPQHGGFVPLTGRGGPYPADARAECSLPPERRSVRIPAGGAGAFSIQRAALMDNRHSAPDPECSCGFHALSSISALSSMAGPFSRRNSWGGLACLTVVLSGRVLAFQWPGGPASVLFRAARQTVVSVAPWADVARTWDEAWTVEQVLAAPTFAQGWWQNGPDDPDGRLARLPLVRPFGSGPVQLDLPSDPVRVTVDDHVAWCGPRTRPDRQLEELVAT